MFSPLHGLPIAKANFATTGRAGKVLIFYFPKFIYLAPSYFYLNTLQYEIH